MGVQGYHRPATVDEAARLLAGTEGARCLAGGATLVAMMNASLAEPKAIVSLSGIAELRGIAPAPANFLYNSTVSLSRGSSRIAFSSSSGMSGLGSAPTSLRYS